jgi:sec-independent protein translocase protein TatC
MSTLTRNNELRESLLDHINHLRQRLVRALAGLAIATAASFIFSSRMLAFLITPYGDQLQLLGPTEGIEIYFKVSLLAGGILAMPYILFQLWLFIAPGLKPSERRLVYLFVPTATLLFLAGIAFTWYVLLPAAVMFLSGFLPDIFFAEWRAREYISFTTRFLFWIGVSFEMPLIIYFFGRAGLISDNLLREQWRVAVVLIAILAAMVTPSVDPITMMLAMGPLLILYGISILTARLGQRQFARSSDSQEADSA